MKVVPTDLRRVSVFKEATEDDLKLLVTNAILRTIEEGEFFFFQGDPANHGYVLTAGAPNSCRLTQPVRRST